jgi:hypothetical protein
MIPEIRNPEMKEDIDAGKAIRHYGRGGVKSDHCENGYRTQTVDVRTVVAALLGRCCASFHDDCPSSGATQSEVRLCRPSVRVKGRAVWEIK